MRIVKILAKVALGVLVLGVLVGAYWVYVYTAGTGRSIFEPIIKEAEVCGILPDKAYCGIKHCKHGYLVMIPGGSICTNGFYVFDEN